MRTPEGWVYDAEMTREPTEEADSAALEERADAPAEDETAVSEPDAEADQEETEDEEPKRRSRPFAAPVVVWIALVLFALTTFALIRIAGEERYQSCVTAAQARVGTGSDGLSRLARVRAVQSCSHSPF